MVEALPQPARLTLEQALGQWRQWRTTAATQPVPVSVLEGGRSNISVLVESGTERWVVRIDGKNPAMIGISRSAEWSALQRATRDNLCPQPVYTNPDLGVLVCTYCPADSSVSAAPAEIERIAELLRDIHKLPGVRFRLDPLDRARRYLNLVGGELSIEFVEACERLLLGGYSPVLCHNDLLRANRLHSGGRLLALDWEYVAMGDPLFDLAVVIEGDGLNELEANTLLASWLDALPGDELRQRLSDNRLVYRELNSLWECVYEDPPLR
jgi:thiamine kinase-like enzyme